jgi:signal transduction histidine kinase
VSPHEHTPRNPRPADAPSAPQLSVTQIEAKVAHELSNLLNVVAACGERVATSPDVTAAARLDLLALAGRVAHAIIDARRRGVSLRRWISVNQTLSHLEAAVRLLLPSAVDVVLGLDPKAGSVHLAPGELHLVILNLVLDARARLGDAGRLEIRSAHVAAGRDVESVTITVDDRPREPHRRADTPENAQFGLATVRLIARDAGGEVELAKRSDGGCEVRIALPARENQAS